jgi:hypothetical protein
LRGRTPQAILNDIIKSTPLDIGSLAQLS